MEEALGDQPTSVEPGRASSNLLGPTALQEPPAEPQRVRERLTPRILDLDADIAGLLRSR
jgi:hypothetical protein